MSFLSVTPPSAEVSVTAGPERTPHTALVFIAASARIQGSEVGSTEPQSDLGSDLDGSRLPAGEAVPSAYPDPGPTLPCLTQGSSEQSMELAMTYA